MYIRLDRILNERRKADKPNIHQGRLQIQNTSLTTGELFRNGLAPLVAATPSLYYGANAFDRVMPRDYKDLMVGK